MAGRPTGDELTMVWPNSSWSYVVTDKTLCGPGITSFLSPTQVLQAQRQQELEQLRRQTKIQPSWESGTSTACCA